MSTRTIAFMCNYCNDIFKAKSIADRHEITCMQNPNCKNCLICKHTTRDATGQILCSFDYKDISRLKAVNCTNFERMN